MIYKIRYYAKPPDNMWRELEWGRFPGQWSAASREAGSTAWEFSKELGKTGYEALLRHFCLWLWNRELPLSKVVKMNPEELTAERRKKEQKLDLPYCAIITH